MEKMDNIFAGVVAPEQQEKVVANPPEQEEKPLAYKVYGHDILINDETAKKYYQTSMKLLVFSNLLVGNFDDKGNYIIPKEIKRDLVVMDKEIDEEGEKFFKAANIYMKKNFYYYIALSMMGDGKAKAALYLYEYVGDYLDKEFLVSHIANFVDDYDQDFRGKVKKAFNLVDVDIPNNDFTTPNLAVIMQRMIDDKIRAYEMYDIMCQAYVMRMLKALEGSEHGRMVIEEYKKLLAKAGKGKLSWIKQKALLDRAVNRLGGYERLKEDLVDTRSLLAETNKQYEEIERKKAAVETLDAPEKEEKKADKKPAAKKAAAKKPAAKAAGKSAGKKKAAGKKKDAKKDDKKKGGGVSLKELSEIAKKVAEEFEKKYGKSKEEKPEKEKPVKPVKEDKDKADKDKKPKEETKEPSKGKDEDEFDALLDDHGIEADEENSNTTENVDPNEITGEKGGKGKDETIDPNENSEENMVGKDSENIDPSGNADEKGEGEVDPNPQNNKKPPVKVHEKDNSDEYEDENILDLG